MSLDRREFLLLAKTLKLDKHDLTGWYMSEKLDGTRCFWDGGISRGLPTKTVPWANIMHPKTGEPKKKIKPVSTGLWSRYGNPIIAPDWFLNQLPCCPLDGELWAGRKNFQLCRSICAGDEPDSRFDQIQFGIFDSPSLAAIFRDGEIKNANFWSQISASKIKRWFRQRTQTTGLLDDFQDVEDPNATFLERQEWLKSRVPEEGRLFLIPHKPLGKDWKTVIEDEMMRLVEDGGEGLMFREPNGLWEPRRLVTSLKYKPFEDAEANVTSVIAGKVGKKGQVLGKIGALVCEARFRPAREHVTFEVGTGFSMEQRELAPKLAKWAKEHPGEEIPVWELLNRRDSYDDDTRLNETFRLGDRITFKYRELSDEGIPKDARFWRKFQGE